MDLPWGDERSMSFVTNVGLITSRGPHGDKNGDNIMAAEWTHHVSYSPGLIAVSINPEHATAENIAASGEFGVSIAAADQNVAASIAGGSSGRDVDKIAVLRALGFSFYKAKRIAALMVEGAAMNAECKVVQAVKSGDHTLFIAEVLEAAAGGKEPLAYHNGKYWKLESTIEKPSEAERDRIASLVAKHRKNQAKTG